MTYITEFINLERENLRKKRERESEKEIEREREGQSDKKERISERNVRNRNRESGIFSVIGSTSKYSVMRG